MRRFRPLAILGVVLSLGSTAVAAEPFGIDVVDARTGRGVPLIELRTVNEIRFVTDSAGWIALDEPGFLGQAVFFYVRGHGYEVPQDGFGYRGVKLNVVAGGRAQIKVNRVNIAERLYRLTGEGIYRDSVLLGRSVPLRSPVLNGQVFGQDSVLEATLGGKIHWFWGDTNRPSYPLGTFGTPGATSMLPGSGGGLDPDRGVDFDYTLAGDGFVAPTADLPGEGPTWLDGLTVLPDPSRPGVERMFASFAKVRPSMAAYRRGIAEYDPRSKRFAEVAPIPLDAPIRPFGHPFHLTMNGTPYVVFADPFPLVRVRADVEHFLNPATYEAFTCLLPGSTERGEAKLDRAAHGSLQYRWRAGAPPLTADWQDKLLKTDRIWGDEALLVVVDLDSNQLVKLARGSTYHNPHRDRWVLIATEQGGKRSNLGEVWYAEADSPLGPWGYARKIVTHDRYSFYNPKQHPVFSKENGRVIFFEGTFTHTFSGNPEPTPRYDYNQIMYKLDLDDPRLNLPRPVYEVEGNYRFGPEPGRRAVFHALDRSGPGTIAVGPFHVYAFGSDKTPATTANLNKYGGDRSQYGIETKPLATGAIGRAWPTPSGAVLPVGSF